MSPALALWLALLPAQAYSTTAPAPTQSSQPASSEAARPASRYAALAERARKQAALAATPCDPTSTTNKLSMKGMTSPGVIYQVDPSFLEEAREKKIRHFPTVSFTIDQQGNPVNVHIDHPTADTIDKSLQDLAQSIDKIALDTVAKYRFKPATCQGKPVPVELNIEINIDFF
jgi:outer membrane biosynthesis protein TonB